MAGLVALGMVLGAAGTLVGMLATGSMRMRLQEETERRSWAPGRQR